MGQEQSQAGGGKQNLSDNDKAALKRFEQTEGLQVVRLLPNSVAHRAGLVPYFDIIIGIDGARFVDIISNAELIDRLEKVGGSGSLEFRFFRDFLDTHRGQRVCFDVFNLHVRSERQLILTLAEAPSAGGLLGCSIEWTRAVDAVTRCWHVVDVLPKSPAAHCADIHPGTDYVLGMQQPSEQIVTLLHNERDFYQRVELWQTLQRTAVFKAQREASQPQLTPATANGQGGGAVAKPANIPHSMLLLIYNSQENAVKEVLVEMGTRPGTPLGLSLATGAIHWIPVASTTDVSALPVMNHFCLTPTSTFETSYNESPAAATSAPPAPTPPAQLTTGGAAGPQAPANPFRAGGRDDLPAYPPPPPLTTAPSTAQPSSGGGSGQSGAPGQKSDEPPRRQQSPPSVVATAEPSYAAFQPSNDDAFPRAGGEVVLPQWAHRPDVDTSGSSDVFLSQIASQTHATAPPPPPPSQHRHPTPEDAPHAAAVRAENAPHHYPDPSQLGVRVTGETKTMPQATTTNTNTTSTSGTGTGNGGGVAPSPPVPGALQQPATQPDNAPQRASELNSPQSPPSRPSTLVAANTSVTTVDAAAISSSSAQAIEKAEPAPAASSSPQTLPTRAQAHPPLPPHVSGAGAGAGAGAALASSVSASQPAVLSPPRPPTHVAKTCLQAVPRPPVNFDLFGETPSKA